MIVEFIGAPGAGKTTLMPVVDEYFRGQDYRPYSVVEAARPFAARTKAGKTVQLIPIEKVRRFLLWQVFYRCANQYRRMFEMDNPILVQQVVLDYQDQRPIAEADKQHVLRWFLHLTGTYGFLKANAQADEVLIFDEGFVHRVVQLFASENESPDLESMKTYLDLIPVPDLVIYSNAPLQECVRRVFMRGVWKRFRKKEPEETTRFIENAHMVVTRAVEHIRNKNWNVIEVDNRDGNLADVKSALLNELNNPAPHILEIAG